MKKVAIVMGSKSDLPKLEAAIDTLKALEIPTTVRVLSAHRTPAQACQLAETAREDGYGVIIAAAGKAAHLAGVLAAHTTLPVIGVPISATHLDGMDALLSTVQMPSGVPVATVAIDGGANAALLAAQIIAVSDPELAKALEERKKKQASDVLAADKEVQDTYR